jgi:hypothetical protein
MMTLDEALTENEQLRKELNDAKASNNKLRASLGASNLILRDALLEKDMIPASKLRAVLKLNERGWIRRAHLLAVLPEYRETAKACSPL